MEDQAPTEQVPLMMEPSPSNDTRDVIFDISFPSEHIAKVSSTLNVSNSLYSNALEQEFTC